MRSFLPLLYASLLAKGCAVEPPRDCVTSLECGDGQRCIDGVCGGDPSNPGPSRPASGAERSRAAAAVGELTPVHGPEGDLVAVHGRIPAPPEHALDPVGAAMRVLTDHREAFGLGAQDELRVARSDAGTSAAGGPAAWVVFDVVHRDVPVFGATIRARTRDGAVTSVLARVAAGLAVPTVPSLSREEAEASLVGAHPGARAEASALVILSEPLFGNPAGATGLAWAVRLRRGLGLETRFVDAVSGVIRDVVVLHSPGVLERAVYTLPGACPAGDADACLAWVESSAQQVFDESGALPGAAVTADARAAFEGARIAYEVMASDLGIEPIAAIGSLRVYTAVEGEVARVVPIDDVPSVLLGRGYAVPDVVAHELVHVALSELGLDAVVGTESAEIQEAIADVLTVFLADGDPWAIGEASVAGVLRSLRDPTIGHVSERVSSLDPHSNSTVFSHALYLLAEGGAGFEGLGLDVLRDVVLTFARQMLSPAMSFDLALDGLWLTALELVADLDGGFSFEQCSGVVNALAAVGIGARDSDGDCFPDDRDTCPERYNPEQISVSTATCHLPVASCRFGPSSCWTLVGEVDVFRSGCEGGGGAWGGIACTDEGADAACIGLSGDPMIIQVYYDIDGSIPGAREANAAACLAQPGIWLPVYRIP